MVVQDNLKLSEHTLGDIANLHCIAKVMRSMLKFVQSNGWQPWLWLYFACILLPDLMKNRIRCNPL